MEIGWFAELPPAEDIIDYEEFLSLNKPKTNNVSTNEDSKGPALDFNGFTL